MSGKIYKKCVMRTGWLGTRGEKETYFFPAYLSLYYLFKQIHLSSLKAEIGENQANTQ